MGHLGGGMRHADWQEKRGSQHELPVEAKRGHPPVAAATCTADGNCQTKPWV